MAKNRSGDEKQVKRENRKKFNVEILGEDITVVGNLSRDYVESLAAYINDLGRDISRAYPTLPRRRLLGLTILNIADDYFQAKEVREDLEEEIEDLEEEKNRLQQELARLREENEELLDLLQEVE